MTFFGFSDQTLVEKMMYQTPVRSKDQTDESDGMESVGD